LRRCPTLGRRHGESEAHTGEKKKYDLKEGLDTGTRRKKTEERLASFQSISQQAKPLQPDEKKRKPTRDEQHPQKKSIGDRDKRGGPEGIRCAGPTQRPGLLNVEDKMLLWARVIAGKKGRKNQHLLKKR